MRRATILALGEAKAEQDQGKIDHRAGMWSMSPVLHMESAWLTTGCSGPLSSLFPLVIEKALNEIANAACFNFLCFGCPVAYGVLKPGIPSKVQLPPKLKLQQ